MNYTPKQHHILQLIFKFQKDKGYSPTYAELAGELKVSTITVFEHLAALERKKAVRRRRHAARSIEIIDRKFLDEQEKREASRRTFAITGVLADGKLKTPAERKQLNLDTISSLAEKCFLLEVKGDHLESQHLHDGDLLMVELAREFSENDVVIVELDGGSTVLKRWSARKNGATLLPVTGTGKALDAKSAKIRGVVRTLIRQY